MSHCKVIGNYWKNLVSFKNFLLSLYFLYLTMITFVFATVFINKYTYLRLKMIFLITAQQISGTKSSISMRTSVINDHFGCKLESKLKNRLI